MASGLHPSGLVCTDDEHMFENRCGNGGVFGVHKRCDDTHELNPEHSVQRACDEVDSFEVDLSV